MNMMYRVVENLKRWLKSVIYNLVISNLQIYQGSMITILINYFPSKLIKDKSNRS